jgi:hypothetical protein
VGFSIAGKILFAQFCAKKQIDPCNAPLRNASERITNTRKIGIVSNLEALRQRTAVAPLMHINALEHAKNC